MQFAPSSSESFSLSIDSHPLHGKEIILFFLVLLSAFGIGEYLGLSVYLGIAILGIASMILLLRNPFLWIIVSIGLYAPVFWKWTTAFTPAEAAHAVIFYGGIFWWFIHRVFIARKKIHWSLGSASYALFMLQVIILIPFSLAYDADSFILARESFVMLSVLFLVPLAHEIQTPREGKIVFVIFMTLPILYSIRNILQYKQKIISAVQFWQIEAGRATDSPFLIFFLIVIAVAFLASTVGRWKQIFWLMILSLSSIALLLTFLRAFWTSAIGCIVLMMWMLGKKFSKRVLKFGVLGIVIAFFSVQTYIGESISLSAFGLSLANRFFSITKYEVDPSVLNRTAETSAALRQSMDSPIFGHGLASRFVHFNIITLKTVRTSWNHNAFAWMFFHFGIIGSVLLLTSYFAYIFKGLNIYRSLRAPSKLDEAIRFQLQCYVVGGFVILLGFLVTLWFGNPYLDRGAFLILSVIYAFFEILDRKLRSEELSLR